MIINLTQHRATPEQLEAGVIDLPEEDRRVLTQYLTFNVLPDHEEIYHRACTIASFALAYDAAMIGGAPYLMAPLEAALKNISTRESIEKPQPDGSIRKINTFRHIGFVK